MMSTPNIPDMLRTSIELAKKARGAFVPVLGAGTAIPLGYPNWKQFSHDVAGNLAHPLTSTTDPLLVLQHAANALGPFEFEARVKKCLTLARPATSLTLQALAATNARKLITVNLDSSIEQTFCNFGRPINPSNVLSSVRPEDLNIFLDDTSQDTRLLKLHGTIERPSTWILTQAQYNAAYIANGQIAHFFEHATFTPLFIGFGFADFDLGHVLRIAAIRAHRASFALVSVKMLEGREAELRASGVIPIPFYEFDQIPELLDEIFDIAPLKARVTWILNEHHRELQVGSLKVNISEDESRSEIIISSLAKTLLNAVEPRPESWITEPGPRRLHGRKKEYLDHLRTEFHRPNHGIAPLILTGLAQCPEIIEKVIAPSLIPDKGIDTFEFVSMLFEVLKNNSILTASILDELRRVLQDGSLDASPLYRKRRTIIKLLAARSMHSGVALEPQSITVGKLRVMSHHLTQFQVRTYHERAYSGQQSSTGLFDSGSR